jgi:hypothetical protein
MYQGKKLALVFLCPVIKNGKPCKSSPQHPALAVANPWARPAPGAHGEYDSLVLPEITVRVILAIATGLRKRQGEASAALAFFYHGAGALIPPSILAGNFPFP